MSGSLYIVGTPIGNPKDISLRAIDVLRSVSLIACEESKEGQKLLRSLDIQKPLIEINEHTENQNTSEVVSILRDGNDVALISDAGMPLFADPGLILVQSAIQTGIPVTTIPGPTSIMSALALSGMDVERFYYYGFLSAKKDERRKELRSLINFPHPIVFLDAPYRLNQVLEDIKNIFGKHRSGCVACDLTLPHEDVQRGTLGDLFLRFTSHKKKCEFVIIVEGVK